MFIAAASYIAAGYELPLYCKSCVIAVDAAATLLLLMPQC